MQNTVVLTLGRLPVALDLARGFAQAGWRVVVAETFGMHLARMSRAVDLTVKVTSPLADPDAYLADLLGVVREQDAALVAPVSEETLRVAELADRLPAGVQLFAADQALLRQVHDKYRFTHFASSLGLRAPRSWTAQEFNTGIELERVVIKPRHSCSGRGVRIVLPAEAVGLSPDDTVQEYIDGAEVSGFGIARDGRLYAPVVYRGSVFSGSVAVCFERLDHGHPAESWMRDFVAATGYSGFIAFDFIIDSDDQCWAIECNPRATSGIHFVRDEALPPLLTCGEPENPYRQERLLTESWSCYTAALGNLFASNQSAGHAFGQLIKARDVTWARDDPWPFLLMPINTAPIIGAAIRQRSSFAAVAVRDVEWRDDDSIGP